ncbi:gtpase-activator for ras gtpase [Fusarium tjaetaba]|uniref:Gtpase-activator for ras gtpase n=1 Tax=Fusarium tjaetaba TaxID=1567544 RepID=A0A8H5QP75_9HYPO|nr:gtpase-activator for ras gtpase [Fusarium tjaetaba]KAF5617331.1 gtpase-activator for ras gtpase [Fusarium tjaetaba]
MSPCKCFTIASDTHVHECYHAIWTTRPVIQPFCGDCAAVFFHKHSYAFWIHPQDLKASAVELPSIAHGSMVSPTNANNDTLGRAVDSQDSNVFLDMPDHHALPRTDITYRRLSTILIEHPRIPTMFLLEFMTFDSLRAYQPCCENIDHLNILKPLRTIEPDGDPVFEAALADNLFTKFNVSVTAPEPDWFMRPRSHPGSPPRPAKQTESTAEHPPSPISNLTTNSEVDDINRLAAPLPSRVLDQLDHHIEAIGVNSHGQPAIFDPTPGGRLFSSRGRFESASASGVSRPWSRNNHTVGGTSPLGVTDTTSSQQNPLPQQSVTLEDWDEEDLFENCSDTSCSVCESLFD